MGKSGSFFYFSHDNQLLIKTISKSEFIFFRKTLLEKYYNHLINNPETLITRIYGLYKIKEFSSSKK